MSQIDAITVKLSVESETLLQGILGNALLGICVIQDNRFVFVNQRLADLFGYSQQEMCAGMGLMTLTAPDDPTVAQHKIDHRIQADAKSSFYGFRGVRKNGSLLDVEVFGIATHFGGRPAIIGILLDVSEHCSRERAAADQLLFIRQLLDNIPSPIFFKDEKGCYLGCNTAFEKYIGIERSNLIGRSVYDISPKDLADKYFAADKALFDKPGTQTYDASVVYADGTRHDVVFYKATVHKVDGSVGGLVGLILDITDRKRAERETQAHVKKLSRVNQELKNLNDNLSQAQSQLLQMEKMASIGQLAAGVAHEINNPIGYVSSNIGTLKSYFSDLFTLLDAYENVESSFDEACREAIRSIKGRIDFAFIKQDLEALLAESQQGITRVKKIVEDLKNFAHVDDLEGWKLSDLHEGLESTLNVVWNELKFKCTVQKEYGKLPLVECLLPQLNQVFMNLLVNAAQAIEEKGTITLRSGTEAGRVWVEVADTGKGILPEHIPRLFEPFFTTKPVGKGTGLGLSVSYSILQKHHGEITVKSTVGGGSAFRVWLPIRQTPGGPTHQ
jgi:PAS domain S-box-containing protein